MGVDCEAIRAKELPNFNVTYVSPSQRPTGAFVDMVIFWLNTVILILSLFIFTLTKFVLIPRHSPNRKYMNVRFYPFILTIHLGALTSLISGSLITFVPFNTAPCWVSLLAVLAPALLAIPPAIRFFTFYRQYQITKAISDASIMARRKPRRASLASVTEMDDDQSELGVPLKYILIGFFVPSRLRIDSAKPVKQEVQATNAENQTQAADDVVVIVRTLKALNSAKGKTIILLICMLPYIIAFFALVGASEFARSGCNTCNLADKKSAEFVLYVGAAVPCIVCVLASFLVRGVPDSLYIVREVRSAFVYFGVPTVIFVILSGTVLRRQDFDFRFLFQMTILGFVLVQSAVPAIAVLYIEYHNRSDSASESFYANDALEFEATLTDPIMHDAFQDHMIAEHSVEALRFHDEVQKWSREFHDVSVKTAELRAKKIVSLFVGDDAIFPVNFSSDVIYSLRASVGLGASTSKGKGNSSFKQSSKAIRHNVEAEKNLREIDQHFFDEADREIQDLMRLDAFSRFRKTKRYHDLKFLQLNSKSSGRLPRGNNDAIVPQSLFGDGGLA